MRHLGILNLLDHLMMSFYSHWITLISQLKITHSRPFLFFDAGGTLVFPDQDFLIAEAKKQNITLTHQQLLEGYYRVIHDWDQYVRQQRVFPDKPWVEGYYVHVLFKALGITGPAAEAVAETAKARHKKKNLWTFTFPWIHNTLSFLFGQGYRMAVISNSDGRTLEVFQELKLEHYFEGIFDSHILGFEKPSSDIFRHALDKLGLQPKDALYIGDTYTVDVYGANQAGLGAIHLDPFELYTDWRGIHLPDVSHLPDWLERYTKNRGALDLFPVQAACRSSNIRDQEDEKTLVALRSSIGDEHELVPAKRLIRPGHS